MPGHTDRTLERQLNKVDSADQSTDADWGTFNASGDTSGPVRNEIEAEIEPSSDSETAADRLTELVCQKEERA